MKNILLGTTALFGVVALSAAANAEGPKVTIGGIADFQAGFLDEDLDTDLSTGAFRSDTELTFDIDGVADNGLKYGGHVTLEADVSDDADNQASSGGNAARTYLYLEGAWGRVQGGSDLGVTNTLKVDASRIARATGGIDGDFTYFITTGDGDNTVPQYIATPDLILDYGTGILGDESQENINKISYYTPRFSGFQAGVSYLFDTSSTDRGQDISRGDSDAGEAENVILGAINWEGKFDQVGINLGATGEYGDAEASNTEDLSSWQVGALVSYLGFSVAGSYGDLGDSLSTTSGVDDRSFYTLGVAYEVGAFGASVTYLDSNFETTAGDNEFTNISVGVDYKLAPGFTPYAEVSYVELDSDADVGDDNDATVFIIGSQLAF